VADIYLYNAKNNGRNKVMPSAASKAVPATEHLPTPPASQCIGPQLHAPVHIGTEQAENQTLQ